VLGANDSLTSTGDDAKQMGGETKGYEFASSMGSSAVSLLSDVVVGVASDVDVVVFVALLRFFS
jgi:hypothetical protein